MNFAVTSSAFRTLSATRCPEPPTRPRRRPAPPVDDDCPVASPGPVRLPVPPPVRRGRPVSQAGLLSRAGAGAQIGNLGGLPFRPSSASIPHFPSGPPAVAQPGRHGRWPEGADVSTAATR
jgi:hypothetical protein